MSTPITDKTVAEIKTLVTTTLTEAGFPISSMTFRRWNNSKSLHVYVRSPRATNLVEYADRLRETLGSVGLRCNMDIDLNRSSEWIQYLCLIDDMPREEDAMLVNNFPEHPLYKFEVEKVHISSMTDSVECFLYANGQPVAQYAEATDQNEHGDCWTIIRKELFAAFVEYARSLGPCKYYTGPFYFYTYCTEHELIQAMARKDQSVLVSKKEALADAIGGIVGGQYSIHHTYEHFDMNALMKKLQEKAQSL